MEQRLTVISEWSATRCSPQHCSTASETTPCCDCCSTVDITLTSTYTCCEISRYSIYLQRICSSDSSISLSDFCNRCYRCFQCGHGDSEELDSTWTELHNQAYQIYSQPKVISVRDSTGRHTDHLLANLYNMSLPFSFLFQFCEFVSVSCLAHVVGKVVRMLLDYVSHVSICFKLRQILQRRPEWDEISDILGKTAETSL